LQTIKLNVPKFHSFDLSHDLFYFEDPQYSA
jgi:hypothetical protein